ncbi:hypothetical protein ACNKHV_13190 [Shigella flexneri]
MNGFYPGVLVCAIVVVVEEKRFSAGEIGWSYACTAIAAICRRFWLAPSLTAFSRPESAGGIDVRWYGAVMYFAANRPLSPGLPLLLAYSSTYTPTIALT